MRFHKRQGISWPAERILSSQEVFCWTEILKRFLHKLRKWTHSRHTIL